MSDEYQSCEYCLEAAVSVLLMLRQNFSSNSEERRKSASVEEIIIGGVSPNITISYINSLDQSWIQFHVPLTRYRLQPGVTIKGLGVTILKFVQSDRRKRSLREQYLD